MPETSLRDRKAAVGARAGDVFRRGVGLAGFDLVRRNFYSPVPQLDSLPPGALTRRAPMPGVDWDMDRFATFAQDLATYITEFSPPQLFTWDNGMYGPIESEVLYAIVRQYKPAHILELGSGFSSLIIAAACRRNRAEGRPCRYAACDPFPRDFVRNGLDGLDELMTSGATDVPMDWFASLAAGDVLFIDTTHTVKVAGDVNRLLLEVLPALAPGVLVHVHDVFLPYEYPREFFENQCFWQEQYLLQALLAENPNFEVLFPATAVERERPDVIRRLMPEHTTQAGPGAFWIRRTGEPAVAAGR